MVAENVTAPTIALTAYTLLWHTACRQTADKEAAILTLFSIEEMGDSEQPFGRPITGPPNMPRRRKSSEEIQGSPVTGVNLMAPSRLKEGVSQFEAFAKVLQIIATEIPARTSLRQVYAFALIVEANSLGKAIIVSDLKDIAGADKAGEPIFGQSIGRSYQLLMEPTKRDPDGLGWIKLETDEDDQRRKIVRLTPKGETIADHIRRTLTSGTKEKAGDLSG